MWKKTDERTSPPRSDRLRGWWFRGVNAEAEAPSPSPSEPPSAPEHEELSSAVQTHLDGMAGHALRIERAAITDGVRIRKEALTAAGKIVEHAEHLESQLALIENQFGRVIDTMRTELADLRAKLDEEAAVADGAGAQREVPTGPVAVPAALPVSSNGHTNGHSPAQIMPVA